MTANTTAGMFFIKTILLTPIPIEHNPKIRVISCLKRSDSRSSNNPPQIPPRKMAILLTIIPTGTNTPLFKMVE